MVLSILKKALKADFDNLSGSVERLRGERAKLEEARCALGAQIREVQAMPLDKAGLKAVMRATVLGFASTWTKPLVQQLEVMQEGGSSPDEFVKRHIAVAPNYEHVQDNGWFSLLAFAMLDSIDRFVDQLDWPEGISDEARTTRLAELSAKLVELSGQTEEINEQFHALGIHHVRPDKAVI